VHIPWGVRCVLQSLPRHGAQTREHCTGGPGPASHLRNKLARGERDFLVDREVLGVRRSIADASEVALRNRTGEEPERGGSAEECADGPRAGGLAEDCDARGVAAKGGDVLVDPLERSDLLRLIKMRNPYTLKGRTWSAIP
jgi:hypothetical protein